jgi:hypothetical protein
MLLLTQLVTSAYACPAIVGAVSSAAAMADMPGCDGNMPATMDPDHPQLCRAHCQSGSQAVPHAQALDAPSVPLLLAVLDWTRDLLLPAQPAARASAVSPGASPPGSPPLYLSLLVLRN